MAHVREQDPIRFKANTMPFFTSITVAELKTRKLIGSCQGSSLDHVREHDPIRFKANTVPFITSITVAELKTRKLIGSRRRARSIRFKDKTVPFLMYAHWLL